MDDEDLLATRWTTAGDAAPLGGDERSPVPLRERIEAAGAAGFAALAPTTRIWSPPSVSTGWAGSAPCSRTTASLTVYVPLQHADPFGTIPPTRRQSPMWRRDHLVAIGFDSTVLASAAQPTVLELRIPSATPVNITPLESRKDA